MKTSFSLFGSFAVSMLIIITGSAQDNHYAWSQYGSRNSILFNANMSRFEDQSAVIVNPATLAGAQQSSFNFNTNAVGFNTIKFKNGLGEGFNLTSSNLNIFPAMASGVIKPKASKGDWVLGYSIYSRNTDGLSFSDRTESKLDIIDEAESPGSENYVAQYNVNTDINEDALVVGIGWHTKNDLAVGLSQTFIYSSQKFNQKYSAYAIPDPGAGASIDLAGTNFNYHSDFYKLITYTKLGFTAKLKKWDFGFTMTSPTLGIFGSGYILADLNLINVRIDPDLTTPRESFVANGEFKNLPVKYKYPVQAAFGISRPFGKVRIYGSLAWFGSLKAYNILEPGDVAFIQPPSDQNVLYTNQLLSLWAINRSLFNGSIAADWLVRENYHFLFSARTDFHYGDIDPEHGGFNSALKQWNNYHVTFGTQRVIGSSEWVIGLQYIFARRDDYPQPISFANPTEDNYFRGERSTGTVTSRGLELLLSYTFTFGGPAKEQ
jgi:hypothetical protein